MHPLSIIATASVRPATDADWDKNVPAAQKRRNPRIWQLASIAVERLLCKTSEKPKSIVVATALGALDETRQFIEGIFTTNSGAPRNFIASVHNSMAGKLALDSQIKGPNITVCDGHNSFASAIITAGLLEDADFPALIVAVDESIHLLERLQPHLSPECLQGFSDLQAEGAAAFLCAKNKTGLPTITAAGPLPHTFNDGMVSCKKLAHELIEGDFSLIDVNESSNFCLQPALIAETLLNPCVPGKKSVIGAYCPASKAASLVVVCS